IPFYRAIFHLLNDGFLTASTCSLSLEFFKFKVSAYCKKMCKILKFESCSFVTSEARKSPPNQNEAARRLHTAFDALSLSLASFRLTSDSLIALPPFHSVH